MLKQMDDWSKTPIQGPTGAEFGQKLKEAVQRRIQNRNRRHSVEPDSFAAKLKAAVQRRIGQRVTYHA
jgi:hypothetical protein